MRDPTSPHIVILSDPRPDLPPHCHPERSATRACEGSASRRTLRLLPLRHHKKRTEPKPRPLCYAPSFLAIRYYFPPLAALSSIGRLSSITTSVPAGITVYRFFTSQCTTVAPLPIAAPTSAPSPPPISAPEATPAPVPIAISFSSRPSMPLPLNSPSSFTSVPLRMLVSTITACRTYFSPFGSVTISGNSPIVGLPLMRRGSVNRVTRPSTVEPTGMTVFPSSDTGVVTRPDHVSPTLFPNVETAFSSLIFTAVPSGSDRLVSATAQVAKARHNSNAHFLIVTPPLILDWPRLNLCRFLCRPHNRF